MPPVLSVRLEGSFVRVCWSSSESAGYWGVKSEHPNQTSVCWYCPNKANQLLQQVEKWKILLRSVLSL